MRRKTKKYLVYTIFVFIVIILFLSRANITGQVVGENQSVGENEAANSSKCLSDLNCSDEKICCDSKCLPQTF